MKPYSAVIVALAGIFTLMSSSFAKELSIERIFSSPALEGDPVRSLQVSPDGTRITFLKGKKSDFERLDLWQYDLASCKTSILVDSDDLHTGSEKLSDEEKARRERMRLKGTGIVSYAWSEDGRALLFPLAGDIFYYGIAAGEAKRIVSSEAFEIDIKFSPKGRYVSFIRDQNIMVYDLAAGIERQLTFDGGGSVKNGMAEFIAQEEMDRMTGYWWSPDESKLAFLQVDESGVEEVSRSEIYAEEIKIVKQRYPYAGKNNVRVRLGIVDLGKALSKGHKRKSRVLWVDLGDNYDIYIPRVKWMRDSHHLTYQWQSRDQKTLRLMRVDLPSLKQKKLIEETSQTWINLHNDLTFLPDQEHFIWSSERSGYNHLYLYKVDGTLVRPLTRGNWVVDKFEAYDKEEQKVYFSARADSPLEKHLYSLSIAKSSKQNGITKISQRPGYHNVEFAKNAHIYVDNFSTANLPSKVSIHNKRGKRLAWLKENNIDKAHPLYSYMKDWIEPEFASFLNGDKTRLYYRLYKPAKFTQRKKYPVLVYLYGGPGVQLVANKWSNRDLLLQHMAQQGYGVFTLDNRGSKFRGKAFEDGLYQAMGQVEIEDQIEGVRFLHTQKWVDKDRIGVHGHSYGGYMTLMAMFKAPDLFKAGVAGAPVTDWHLYDTHYTERYLGHPAQVPQAYQASSVFPYAKNLSGDLLIYHGMADDNVLFKNSTKLYKLLQDNNIPFMVMDYPGKKHSIKGKTTQMHRANMIRNFFDLHFGIDRE